MRISEELMVALSKNNCVVFVGAGLSVGANLPSWSGLLYLLLDHLKKTSDDKSIANEIEKLINKNKLLLAAKELKRHLGSDFGKHMRQIFQAPDIQPQATHELITQLPFHAALTTNYDNLLNLAYKGTKPVYTHRQFSELGWAIGQDDFYILKLHGSIDDIETIILTTSDYKELTFSNQAYKDFVKALFITKTILFLGFSLNDTDLDMFMTELNVAFKGSSNRHYALMHSEGLLDAEVDEYESQKNIKIIKYAEHKDVETFLQQLLDELPEDGGENEIEEPAWEGSPFPGLEAFDEEKAEIFFGRDREIAELKAKLLENHLTMVFGSSGSGKSSLVAAGLIPKLKDDGQWHIIRFSPEKDPIMSLAWKAAEVLEAQDIIRNLISSPETIIQQLDSFIRKKDPDAKILLFVDQFEELFTLAEEKVQESFIELLKQPFNRVHIIITMRADFYHHAVKYLATELRECSFPLAAPDPNALRQMIEEPAKRARLTLGEGLVDNILRDVGNDPGALALMAYLLSELYEKLQGKDLTLKMYEEAGGVADAIGQQAQATFNELPPAVQAELGNVFQMLVVVQADGKKPTRRRAHLSDFEDDANSMPLINSLTNRRLLIKGTIDDDEGNSHSTIEVAHEALFRSWPELADWIAESGQNIYLKRDMKTDAIQWDEAGRKEYLLWPHERLLSVDMMIEYLNPKDLTSIDYDFIQPESDRISEQLSKGNIEKYTYEYKIERLRSIKGDELKAQLSALKNKNEIVRELAVEQLGRLGDESAVEALIAILNQARKDDMIDDLGFTAREAIVQIGGSRACQYFMDYLSELSSDLAKTPDDSAEYSRLHNGEFDDSDRIYVIQALGRIGMSTAYDALEQLTSNSNEDRVRYESIKALIRICDKRTLDKLLDIINDDRNDSNLKKVTLSGIPDLKDKRTAQALVALLSKFQDDNLYHEIIQVLGKLRDTSVFETLEEIAKKSEAERAAMFALAAIAQLRDIRGRDLLLLSINNPQNNQWKRIEVIKALAHFHDEAIVDSLIELLQKDEEANIRAAATISLGRLNNHRASKHLLHAIKHDTDDRGLGDAHNSVQILAVEALGELQDPSVFEDLATIIWSKENHLHIQYDFIFFKTYIMDILRLIDPQRAITELRKVFTSHENQKLRQRSALQLAILKQDDGHKTLLNELYTERSYDSIIGLGYLPSRRGTRKLREILNGSYDRNVKRVALLSLLQLEDDEARLFLQTRDAKRNQMVYNIIQILLGSGWLNENRDTMIQALQIAGTSEAINAIDDWKKFQTEREAH